MFRDCFGRLYVRRDPQWQQAVPCRTGETVKVERLPGEVGGQITFEDVLAIRTDEKKLLTGAEAAQAKVIGKIVEQGRHPKLTVMKYRRTKQYKIIRGHRQDYTAAQVNDITI